MIKTLRIEESEDCSKNFLLIGRKAGRKMQFKKKMLDEALTNVELCAGDIEITTEFDDVGYCVSNNHASGCGGR